MGFGDLAHHFDIDDWSKVHKRFTQGDAAELSKHFGPNTFDLVILGDILEHVADPAEVLRQACLVSKAHVCATIFEEWRLPGPGQHIEAGRAAADADAQALGYKDNADYQAQVHPDMVSTPEEEVPHLCHINQFTEQHINEILSAIPPNWAVAERAKVFECFVETHPVHNWLIALQRLPE